MKNKRLLMAALAIAILCMSSCSYKDTETIPQYAPIRTAAEQSPEPESTPQPLPTPMPESTVEPIDRANLVTEAFHNELGYRVISIPQINLDSTDVQALNQEIWSEMHDNVYQYILKSIEETDINAGSESIRYRWTAQGDILSLLITVQPEMYEWTEYYAYNIRISDGKALNKNEFLDMLSISEDEYHQLITASVKTYYDKTNYMEIDNQATMEMEAKTLSQENLNSSVPYLDEDGSLRMILLVQVPAGAGAYYHTLPVLDAVPALPSDD